MRGRNAQSTRHPKPGARRNRVCYGVVAPQNLKVRKERKFLTQSCLTAVEGARGGFLPYNGPCIGLENNRESDMESIISNLVARFEKGSLSRRELVRGLAMLAASGTAATAQEDINFKAANIDHVSVQVGNLQKSID